MNHIDYLCHYAKQRKSLCREEEYELADRARAGDVAARNRLVESNLLFVAHMVQPWARSGVPLADLVQAGAIGLMRAAAHFDSAHGVRFRTYASYWVLAEVRILVVSMAGALRMGCSRRQRDVMFRIRGDVASIEASGPGITHEEACRVAGERCGLTLDEVVDLLTRLQRHDSFDNPVGQQCAYHETIPDPAADVLDRALEAAELRSKLARFPLSERETALIRRHLVGNCTLEEIGSDFGVSRERMRRIEERLLVRLQRLLPRMEPIAA